MTFRCFDGSLDSCEGALSFITAQFTRSFYACQPSLSSFHSGPNHSPNAFFINQPASQRYRWLPSFPTKSFTMTFFSSASNHSGPIRRVSFSSLSSCPSVLDKILLPSLHHPYRRPAISILLPFRTKSFTELLLRQLVIILFLASSPTESFITFIFAHQQNKQYFFTYINIIHHTLYTSIHTHTEQNTQIRIQWMLSMASHGIVPVY
mmetsp:Transcript_11128/g.12493  ORF Transcript_11128/g.12493 Transcript_11128/m.12493 type:complete len:207 (-) Transcript_11128:804-1424(-)